MVGIESCFASKGADLNRTEQLRVVRERDATELELECHHRWVLADTGCDDYVGVWVSIERTQELLNSC